MTRFPKRRGAPPDVGDTAPRFTLRRTFEQDIALDEILAGSAALVAFYVFDFGHV